MSGAGAQAVLSDEQQRRAAINRQKAKERRLQREAARMAASLDGFDGPDGAPDAAAPPVSANAAAGSKRAAAGSAASAAAAHTDADEAAPQPKRRRGKVASVFLKDSGGGFFVEEEEDAAAGEWDADGDDDEEAGSGAAAAAAAREPVPQDLPSYPHQPRCENCGREFFDSKLQRQFGLAVCNKCRDKHYDDKYALITKTEAKQEYLLQEVDLDGGPGSLRFIEKKNPNHETWGKMKLFLLRQVEERSFAKFGGEEGLDAEIVRRATEKSNQRDKRDAKKMAKLRRNTMTSTWLKMKNKDKAHEHEFRKEDEKYCEDTDDWVKTCATCGFEVHFDKF